MADINETILEYIAKHSILDTLQYAKDNKLDHQKVIGAIKSIQTYDGVRMFIINSL